MTSALLIEDPDFKHILGWKVCRKSATRSRRRPDRGGNTVAALVRHDLLFRFEGGHVHFHQRPEMCARLRVITLRQGCVQMANDGARPFVVHAFPLALFV